LSKSLSVLLASGTASGTIAAVRNLGSSGIDVQVVSNSLLSAAAWSRWVSRSHRAPPETDGRFLDRLLAIGKTNSGQILLPTSDETVWLYTAYADILVQHFCLYQPPVATIRSVLDKQLFAAAATSAGLGVLPSWNPKRIEDVEALASLLPYPILIKPRTHVHRLRNDKGIVVHSRDELILEYKRFVEREQFRVSDMPFSTDGNAPLLQQFVDVGSEGVVSVTGFVDRSGEHFVSRHARKIFQRSRPVGVGVCFESRPSDRELTDLVRRLCRSLGYFGIFEVEFLRFNSGWVAIDFNPRLFNQLGMDIRRGAPLPLLACLDAAGENFALRNAIERTRVDDVNLDAIFFDRFTLGAILSAQALTGRTSRRDRLYWRGWAKQRSAYAVDAALDRNDPLPGVIHALSEVHLGLKKLPAFLRLPAQVAPPANLQKPEKAAS
jgi:D-aspartate ligase